MGTRGNRGVSSKSLASPRSFIHSALMSARKPTAAERARHALLSAWRGAEEPSLVNLPTVRVADLVAKIAAQSGMADRMRLEDVLSAWREIVGDFLFQHSRPDSIQRGVLMVRVLQPSVHHALAMERPRILKRLQERLKGAGIKDIRLKHG